MITSIRYRQVNEKKALEYQAELVRKAGESAGGKTTGATDMTTKQPEALPALIERFRGLHFDHAPDGWPAVRTREITALLDRITELESQLAQRFDAADVATAAAQGFRDGVASVSAGSEPVASCAIRLLVAADLITQAGADAALRLAAKITPATADGESK